MRALLHTEFDALLARAGVSPASLARLTGVTACQVVPQWAAPLAATLQDVSPEALTIALDEVEFSWREILGLSLTADPATARRAISRLALRHHSDKGAGPSR